MMKRRNMKTRITIIDERTKAVARENVERKNNRKNHSKLHIHHIG